MYGAPIKHCKSCGTAVEHRLPDDGDTKVRAVCPACTTVHYVNPLNVVGTIPVWGDKVLLCKRNIEPRLGKWTLPAGFMEMGETTADGAARETVEEAGAEFALQALFSLVNVARVGQVHLFYRAELLSDVFNPGTETQEAADAAKKDPSSFTWTSLGGAGAQDMLNRQFFKALNIDITKTRALQLKGGSEAVTMTAGGHVNLGVGSYSAIAAPLQAKKLRVLAVASSERWPNLPDTPTAKEAGFPSIEVLYWIGFSGPKGLPADIVAKWDLAVKEITSDPAIKDSLLKVGLLTSYSNAADMEARVRKEQAETNALWAQ
jgi:ADP-ribose pyrophosphatase YjhB (NUDIX family)